MSSKKNPKKKNKKETLRNRLEKYNTTDSKDPSITNCWFAYQKERAALLEEKKQENEKQIHINETRKLLADASTMSKWADFQKKNGRPADAHKDDLLSKDNIAKAQAIFKDDFTEEDKKELNDSETECLLKGFAPSYPYKCNKTKLREMEYKEKDLLIEIKEQQLSNAKDLMKRMVECLETAALVVSSEEEEKRIEEVLNKYNEQFHEEESKEEEGK